MSGPEIRLGLLLRFSGREAIQTQRWTIALLVVAKAILMFSLAMAVLLSVLKPELLHIVNGPNNRIECSGLLCPLLKLPLVGRLIGAMPLHFGEVRSADVRHNDVRHAFERVLRHPAEAPTFLAFLNGRGRVLAPEEVFA
jgi:hypothetical protein